MRNPTITSFPDTDKGYIREQAKALRENTPYTKEDEARDRIFKAMKAYAWPWQAVHMADEVTFGDIARAEREREPKPVTIKIEGNDARTIKWGEFWSDDGAWPIKTPE